MKFTTMLGNVLTFGLRSYLEEKRLAEEAEVRCREEARRTCEVIAGIDRFPIRTLTPQEFGALPKGSDLDLKTCAFGTWFVCAPFPPAPDVTVLGHVVPREEILLEQWGAGLSPPDRWVNRYRLRLA